MQPTLPLILISSVTLGVALALGYRLVFAVLDQLNARYLDDLRTRMRSVGYELSWLTALLRLRMAMAAGTFLFVWLVLGMLPVGVMLGLFAYSLLPAVLDIIVENRRVRIRDQMVLAVREVTNQTRAGISLERGLIEVSRNFPEPLGSLLWGSLAQVEKGRDFREVMLELKQRVSIDSMTLFVTVLLIAHSKGGDPNPVLDRIGQSLEETQRLERKRQADTASGRLVVNLLAVFPLLFLLLAYTLDAESAILIFTTIEGQVVLCIVGLLVYVSIRWARAILGRLE
jgi:Flp pilus assembly protein TadB